MVGCDLHDRAMLLRWARGREAAETWSVQNTREGRRRMIERLHERAAAAKAQVIFAYEASGQGFGLYDELTAAGIECHVLAPTKLLRTPHQKRNKTDERDAEQLLQLLRGHVLAGNPLPDVWIPDPTTRDDRELVRVRLDAADKVTAVKTQVKSLLKCHRLERPAATGNGWTRGFRGWLRGCVVDPKLSGGVRSALESLLRQLDFLEVEVKRLDRQLSDLAEQPRYARGVEALLRMSGVGLITALVFLTELGDLRRFRNRRQVSAYLGLAPTSHESGETSDRKGHISRQGPSRVRRVLCQAAWARVRPQGSDEVAYRRLVQRNPKHKKIAVVATMRRLAVRMWHTALEAPETTIERLQATCGPRSAPHSFSPPEPQLEVKALAAKKNARWKSG
jgi:transposase